MLFQVIYVDLHGFPSCQKEIIARVEMFRMPFDLK